MAKDAKKGDGGRILNIFQNGIVSKLKYKVFRCNGSPKQFINKLKIGYELNQGLIPFDEFITDRLEGTAMLWWSLNKQGIAGMAEFESAFRKEYSITKYQDHVINKLHSESYHTYWNGRTAEQYIVEAGERCRDGD